MGRSPKVVPFRAAPETSPNIQNGKVNPPRSQRNAERRPQEYLTPAEVEALMAAAGSLGRNMSTFIQQLGGKI